jgi:hypothetical protein
MVSASISGIYGWCNSHYLALPGALRLSPSHGAGLRAPFLFGSGVAIEGDPNGAANGYFSRREFQ